MYIFREDTEGWKMAGPFFCSREYIRGMPYEIRKNYLIIHYRDAKITIAYLQKAEDVDS